MNTLTKREPNKTVAKQKRSQTKTEPNKKGAKQEGSQTKKKPNKNGYLQCESQKEGIRIRLQQQRFTRKKSRFYKEKNLMRF